MRIAAAGTLALSLAFAPYQCKRDPDSIPKREDTAGDALWKLALDFDARGNAEAARDTRRFLVTNYPSNRHAQEARSMLGLGDAGSRAGEDGGPR
jgi:hypothetical protein